MAVCQHVGNLAHDTRRCLSDFVKTEEVVTMCRSSTLKGVVGSPPLTDITMLTSTTADRTCHLEGSCLATGRRSKKMKVTTFKATRLKQGACKSKRYRQFQQRIAETWFRHIFLPAFKSSSTLKNTRQSRRFRNEQFSFSSAISYVPENVYITDPSEFFDHPCEHLRS